MAAVYLVWLSGRTFRTARVGPPWGVRSTRAGAAWREDVLVEALNPNTAAFFLAFLPQFVDPVRPPGVIRWLREGSGVVMGGLNDWFWADDCLAAFGAIGTES